MISLISRIFSIFNKFKFPTIIGLSIIFLGLISGMIFTMQNQPLTFLTKAGPDQTPQNIVVSNIEDVGASISWQTTSDVTGFITFGVTSPGEQTIIDDRDSSNPRPRTTHYVTLKKLTPQTTYQVKIFSGRLPSSEIIKITTTAATTSQNDLKPAISSVLQGSQPVEDGIAYLSIAGANIQSAPIKDLGNFIIPLNKMASVDLSNIFTPDPETIAKINVISNLGQASAIFKIKDLNQTIGPLKIGQDLDLTTATPTITPTPEIDKYDLNGDGLINANDNAILLKNFGKSPKNIKADLNGDGVVDKKDVDLMAKRITTQGQATSSATSNKK